jgi:carboxylesterase
MISIQDETAPFSLPGKGERAASMVLMVHSFTGSPLEFRRLGDFLNGYGYSVSAVRLPGHGTSLKDMAKTRWCDWWNHIVSTYEDISAKGIRNIVAIGHSMGGLLALKLAMEKKLDGMVCISTPIYIQKSCAFAEVLCQWLGITKNVPRIPDPGEAFYYEKPPLSCLLSLWALLNSVKRSLPCVSTPIMIGQGRKDRVVHPRSADYIYASTSSALKKINYYPNSSHSILLDCERDQLYTDIYQFLNAVMG